MNAHDQLQQWATGVAQSINGYNVIKPKPDGTAAYVLHDEYDQSLLRLEVNRATEQIEATIVGTRSTFVVHSLQELREAVRAQTSYSHFFMEKSGAAPPSEYPPFIKYTGARFR